jgi:Ca2+-binding EF-hand superfamily protein
MLPLDGNPSKSMATVAHPGELACVTSSFDGQYLITAGGTDRSVKLWAVNTNALRASAELDGNGMDPFLTLVQGGRDGKFFQELLDYFYFAQLNSQGINTTAPRVINGHISTEQVIKVMCALGFYPSLKEEQDIHAEVRFQHFGRVGPLRNQVDLEALIRLYVNHRPVAGIGKEDFKECFRALGLADGQDMTRQGLIESLATLGDEKMSPEELANVINDLLSADINQDPLAFMQSEDAEDGDESLPNILNKIPQQFGPIEFAEQVLGFNNYDNEAKEEEL